MPLHIWNLYNFYMALTGKWVPHINNLRNKHTTTIIKSYIHDVKQYTSVKKMSTWSSRRGLDSDERRSSHEIHRSEWERTPCGWSLSFIITPYYIAHRNELLEPTVPQIITIIQAYKDVVVMELFTITSSLLYSSEKKDQNDSSNERKSSITSFMEPIKPQNCKNFFLT